MRDFMLGEGEHAEWPREELVDNGFEEIVGVLEEFGGDFSKEQRQLLIKMVRSLDKKGAADDDDPRQMRIEEFE